METKEKSIKQQQKQIFLSLIVFIAAVITIIAIGYLTLKPEEEIIQGEIEVSEYRVACKLPGRIKELRVNEGDFVHKGDTLAIISMPEINAQEKVMEQTANATESLSDLTELPNKKEIINSAYQIYQQAITAFEVAKKTYDRLNRLFQEGVISAQKRDEAEAAYKTTKSAVEVARSQWELSKSSIKAEATKVAKKHAQVAKSAADVVKNVLKETVQCATADGEVETIYPKVGELIGLGSPIMSISMTKNVWGTFNVREDQLNGFKVGDIIKAYIPAFKKDIKLRIISIKDQGTYAVWKATRTNGDYDLKTFEVKAKPIKPIDGLCSGMTLILKR